MTETKSDERAEPSATQDGVDASDAQERKVEAAKMPRWQVVSLCLSGLGFALSLFLEQLHVQTHTVPNADHFCTVGATFDCAAVAASPYAIFLGLPWAIWGALGFLALGIASYRPSGLLLPLSGIAAAVSVALLSLSVTVIGSLCLLCEAVHVVSIALFIVAYRARQQMDLRKIEWKEAATVLSTPLGLVVGLAIGLPAYWGSFNYRSEPPFPTGVTEEGHHWIGSESPTVTIQEYVNYRCPHCKIATARMLRALEKNDAWRVVRRPLEPGGCPKNTTVSCRSARMAFCAGEQGKFWRADRWLFAHAEGDDRYNNAKMIADLELDPQDFESCYVGEKSSAYTNETFKEAQKKRLTGVPSYEITSEGPLPAELEPLQALGKTRAHKRQTLRDLIEEGKSSK